MGKIDVFEEQKLKNLFWVGPNYYDYPDGEDLFGKLKFTTLVAGTFGLITGSAAANGMPNTAKTFKGKILRTARFFIPCVGVAVLFTTTTYFSTRLRKKDDEINYLIGGIVSGSLLGVATPYPPLGFLGALCFGIGGYVKKYHKMAGLNLIPKFHKGNLPSYYLRNWNTSLIEERKGNWTRDPIVK